MVRAGGFVSLWGDTGLHTPGPGSFGCNGLEELSQVGYITVRAAARYSKVQNIVKLYLYYFVTTRDGMETKTIPPHELLFCACAVQLLEELCSARAVSDPQQQRLCSSALGHLSLCQTVSCSHLKAVSGGRNMPKLSKLTCQPPVHTGEDLL